MMKRSDYIACSLWRCAFSQFPGAADQIYIGISSLFPVEPKTEVIKDTVVFANENVSIVSFELPMIQLILAEGSAVLWLWKR